MYMLSAHQQIEPARPSITSRQAKKQGRRASHGQGAWSFVERGRFKIAARVGRINATAPRSKLALAGFGLLWPALAGTGWHWQDWLAPAGYRLVLVKTEGRGQPAGVPAPGPMAAHLLGSAGLDQSQRVELLQGTEWLSPPSRGRFISCGGSRDGPCLANNYWSWRSGARPRVVWFSQSRLHPPEKKPAHRAPAPPRVRRARGAVQLPSSPPARLARQACQVRHCAPGPVLVPVLVLQGGSPSSCPGQGLPGLPPGRQRRAGLVGRRHRRPTRSQIEVGPWPSHPGDELEPAHPGGVQASQMVPSRQ